MREEYIEGGREEGGGGMEGGPSIFFDALSLLLFGSCPSSLPPPTFSLFKNENTLNLHKHTQWTMAMCTCMGSTCNYLPLDVEILNGIILLASGASLVGSSIADNWLFSSPPTNSIRRSTSTL